jgi:hypothetical protein
MVRLKTGRYYDLDGDLLRLSDIRKLEEHCAVRVEAPDMVTVTRVKQQSRYWQWLQYHRPEMFDFELLAGSRKPPLQSRLNQLIILRKTIHSLQYLREVPEKDILLYIRKIYKSNTFIDILKGVKP